MNESKKAEVPCCICGDLLVGDEGNDPSPINEDGKCCDSCYTMVIGRRLRDAKRKQLIDMTNQGGWSE